MIAGSKDNPDDNVWDDSLLVKAYDDSVKLAREEVARRIAQGTNNQQECVRRSSNSSAKGDKTESIAAGAGAVEIYKVGHYARATYDDGIDYEGKILSISQEDATCVLKYVGYENEQVVAVADLVPSWGVKARRMQAAKAKMEETGKEYPKEGKSHSSSTSKKPEMKSKRYSAKFGFSTVPPPPPMPPMFAGAGGSAEDCEHLSAMLMSWYMSGYYTGVYQGMQIAKKAQKSKK